MIDSPCYQNGSLSCLSCHSMHDSDPNDQLAAGMHGNDACLQCHPSIAADLPGHTNHATASSGSQCYNCHMPHTTYAQQKAIRSHRVQSPRIAVRQQQGQPNACNLCHLDQTLAWTAEWLHTWYGQPLEKLREEESSIAASLLWLLKGDAAQRVITAWHMGWQPALEASGRAWQLPFLAQMLDDDYAAIRFVASKALRRYDGFATLKYDFVANRDVRRAKLQEALELWSQKPMLDSPIASRNHLLMDPQTGQLHDDRVNDLLKRQDKRAIYFPE